jgi:hypothetical protein
MKINNLNRCHSGQVECGEAIYQHTLLVRCQNTPVLRKLPALVDR